MQIIPELIVNDIKKATDEFINILDFSIDFTDPESEDFEWVQLSKEEQVIMLQSFEATKKEVSTISNNLGASLFIVIKSNNSYVKMVYDRVKEYKKKLFIDLHETSYGTLEFGFFSIDNYMILVSGI